MRLPIILWISVAILAGCTSDYDAVGQVPVEVIDSKGPVHALSVAENILKEHGYVPMHHYVDNQSSSGGLRFYVGHNAFASLEQTTPYCFTLVSYVKHGSSEFASAKALLFRIRGQAHKPRPYRIPFGDACSAP
jgi:hypothetical protein